MGTESYFIPRAPIPRYRQYHRPIDSPEHIGCNRSVATDSVGRATRKEQACPNRVDTGRLREVKVLEDELAA